MTIVIICMLMMLVGTAAGLRHVMRIYSRSMYAQTDVALNGIAAQVEGALNGISLDIRRISVEEQLQEGIRQWQAPWSPAARMTAEHRVTAALFNALRESVGGVHFCAPDGHRLTVGRVCLSGEQVNQAVAAANRQTDEYWTAVSSDQRLLCLAIPVHSIRASDYYDSLGCIAAEVNLGRILRGLLGPDWEQSDEYRVCIVREGEPLYPAGENRMADAAWSGLGEPEIGIKHIDGERRYRLIDCFRINNARWMVSVDIPAERLSGLVRRTYGALALTALIIVGLTGSIVWRLARSISVQFNALMAKMKLFESGSYQPPREIPAPTNDELTELNSAFDRMAAEYNHIVKENYVKQLLITETRLQALEHQINPHFIFNTLEIINYYAKRGDGENITTVVHALADLLRASIDQRENTVSLAREMAFVENFMRIQSRRFRDMLTCRMDIAPDVLDARLPKLAIMPLVDNAIRYTLEEEEHCDLRVTACRRGEMLYVGVTDNGPPLEEDIVDRLRREEVLPNGNGIGLLNIDSRIKLIFGEDYGLRVENGVGEMTISFMIPLEKHAEGEGEAEA